jgi:quercetin dioxygenase-like cupin family protein
MKSWLTGAAGLALLALAVPCGRAGAEPSPTFAGLTGTLVLQNPRVRVERFVLEPGQSMGRRRHPDDQLLVFIRGGVLRSLTTGRSTLWRDGRVLWEDSTDPAGAGTTNVGATPIEMICVTIKPVALPAPTEPRAAVAAAASNDQHADEHLNYPNIPGEDLFENGRVIVQRFTVKPGEWEGVHAHGPNMLYIHIKGGQWATRSKKEREHPYPNPSPDGEVGWMTPIDISEGHESGNIGATPIDLIWVTLKE